MGGVYAIFHVLGTQKHRKCRCFWLRVSTKPRYLRGFEPLLAKITVFTVFLWPGPSKNTCIYAVSSMLPQAFFGSQKHCKLHDFYAWTAPKKHDKSTKMRPKNAQQGPPKRIFEFYPLFSTPNPQNVKTPAP